MQFKWSNIAHSKIFKFGFKCVGLKHKGLRPDTVYITYTELQKYMTENHHDLQSAEKYLNRVVYPTLTIRDSKVVLVYL